MFLSHLSTLKITLVCNTLLLHSPVNLLAWPQYLQIPPPLLRKAVQKVLSLAPSCYRYFSNAYADHTYQESLHQSTEPAKDTKQCPPAASEWDKWMENSLWWTSCQSSDLPLQQPKILIWNNFSRNCGQTNVFIYLYLLLQFQTNECLFYV